MPSMPHASDAAGTATPVFEDRAFKVGPMSFFDYRDGVLHAEGVALPAIADAVGDRLTVLADSGVRSGLDVVRMLALGAHGVLLGRAWLYALAARGEAGVAQLLDLIEKEMRVAMTLTGVNTIAKIDRSILVSAKDSL